MIMLDILILSLGRFIRCNNIIESILYASTHFTYQLILKGQECNSSRLLQGPYNIPPLNKHGLIHLSTDLMLIHTARLSLSYEDQKVK